MVEIVTKEWVFDAAQTDFLLQAVGATERMVPTYAEVSCSGSNSVNVQVRMGLATATLPTVTLNSGTGNPSMIMSHYGIRPGGGKVSANSGQPLAIGAVDEDLRLTCTAPTGGHLTVIVGYRLLLNQ